MWNPVLIHPQGRENSEYGISLEGNKHFKIRLLRLLHNSVHITKHWTVHCKQVSFMVCKLYIIKLFKTIKSFPPFFVFLDIFIRIKYCWPFSALKNLCLFVFFGTILFCFFYYLFDYENQLLPFLFLSSFIIFKY